MHRTKKLKLQLGTRYKLRDLQEHFKHPSVFITALKIPKKRDFPGGVAFSLNREFELVLTEASENIVKSPWKNICGKYHQDTYNYPEFLEKNFSIFYWTTRSRTLKYLGEAKITKINNNWCLLNDKGEQVEFGMFGIGIHYYENPTIYDQKREIDKLNRKLSWVKNELKGLLKDKKAA